MTIWRMRITCWIPKATNTPSDYVTFNVFLQNTWWLHKVHYRTYPEHKWVFIKIKTGQKTSSTPTVSVAITIDVTHRVCLWMDRHFKKYGRWLKFRFILQSLKYLCLCVYTHKAKPFCTLVVSSGVLTWQGSRYVFKPCEYWCTEKRSVTHTYS